MCPDRILVILVDCPSFDWFKTLSLDKLFSMFSRLEVDKGEGELIARSLVLVWNDLFLGARTLCEGKEWLNLLIQVSL